MGMAYIDRDQFDKVDLRVGKVVEAERVEGSRKLLRLVVDLGAERRQIVAGIAERYTPQQLVGKYVVVVANLRPRRIMGMESQGMLLATCDEPVLVVPEGGGDEVVGRRVC